MADAVICLAVPSLARWTVIALNSQRKVYFAFNSVRFMRRRNALKWIAQADVPEGSEFVAVRL